MDTLTKYKCHIHKSCDFQPVMLWYIANYDEARINAISVCLQTEILMSSLWLCWNSTTDVLWDASPDGDSWCQWHCCVYQVSLERDSRTRLTCMIQSCYWNLMTLCHQTFVLNIITLLCYRHHVMTCHHKDTRGHSCVVETRYETWLGCNCMSSPS